MPLYIFVEGSNSLQPLCGLKNDAFDYSYGVVGVGCLT